MSSTTGLLVGRRCLITAAASGLGLEIAVAFQRAGAKVAVCDLPGEKLDRLTAEHPDWLVFEADVADEAAVKALFAAIDDTLGGLDVLVNNAGIAGPTAPIEQVTAEQWRQTLDVNLFGTFLCTREAVARLRAAGGGAIVNLSSSAGKFGFPLRSPYAASKWGVVGFTKSMAIELGPYGITANAILPGLVGGARLDAVIAARAERSQRTFEEQKASMLSRVAMGASVQASDIAAAATFLASPQARYITGESLSVDAGLLSLV